MPSLHWHSYYALFGSLGAWLVVARLLSWRPQAALAVVALLALLRAGRSGTVLHDWGEESYVRRAVQTLALMRSDLQAKWPRPARHTRFYFRDVPSEVGFLIGDGPALRVWYDDPTLQGRFYRDFRVRATTTPSGPDRFLRYDLSSAGRRLSLALRTFRRRARPPDVGGGPPAPCRDTCSR
jgi:hypothetical protein